MKTRQAYGHSHGKRLAVVLLSGGLDSATLLALARRRGYACHCLTFVYGQRHVAEIAAARRVAASLGAEKHIFLRLDTRCFAGSALTDRRLAVPKAEPRSPAPRSAIPSTYVPGRNTIFLAHALAYAEVIGSRDIFIGVNAVDFSGYPDCRPAYIQAFRRLARLATAAGIKGKAARIHAPLLKLSKARIIRLGMRLGVNYRLTHSCYDPDRYGRACGQCDSCRLRQKGFRDAGVPDPTRYAPRQKSVRKKGKAS
ncbi:MAG: 7-cyano-7-deazaguanine synthase QueC [Planctomycetota bacterium]|nr:7-cyano-7-deazaguanine synthase QueC [Planctomycetota bacterium]